MRFGKTLLAAGTVMFGLSGAGAQTSAPVPSSPINAAMTGDLVPTHDPVMIKEGDTFYVYGTGSTKEGGISSPAPRRI